MLLLECLRVKPEKEEGNLQIRDHKQTVPCVLCRVRCKVGHIFSVLFYDFEGDAWEL